MPISKILANLSSIRQKKAKKTDIVCSALVNKMFW